MSLERGERMLFLLHCRFNAQPRIVVPRSRVSDDGAAGSVEGRGNEPVGAKESGPPRILKIRFGHAGNPVANDTCTGYEQ